MDREIKQRILDEVAKMVDRAESCDLDIQIGLDQWPDETLLMHAHPNGTATLTLKINGGCQVRRNADPVH